MKRHLLIIAICLLLGAVVNVAVAWACAAWVTLGSRPEEAIVKEIPFSGRRFSGWIVGMWRRPGAVRVLSVWVGPPDSPRIRPWTSSEHYVSTLILNSPLGTRVGDEDFPIPSWSRLHGATMKPDPKVSPSLIEDARGWPMLSLGCSFRVAPNGGAMPVRAYTAVQISPATIGTVPYSPADLGPLRLSNWAEPRVLPLVPLWLGFAINTIFYAALLWLPFALRRFLRLKRGLCPKCAYPMGEADVCTECGCELPKRVRTA